MPVKRLISCTKAAVALELAAVLPLFLMIFSAIIEFALIFLASFTIDFSSNISTRSARIGVAAGIPTLEASIRQQIVNNTVAFIDPSRIIITTSSDDYASLPKPEQCLATPPKPAGQCGKGDPFIDENGNSVYDGNVPQLVLGTPSSRIKINVYYEWNILNPLMWSFIGDQGKFIISTNTYYQNEPL